MRKRYSYSVCPGTLHGHVISRILDSLEETIQAKFRRFGSALLGSHLANVEQICALKAKADEMEEAITCRC